MLRAFWNPGAQSLLADSPGAGGLLRGAHFHLLQRRDSAAEGRAARALGQGRAFIEFVQGLSIVHRDRDFWDWVADTVAIVMALAPMILVWWRRVVRSGQKNIDI
jgi:hypothetical protein